MTHNKGFNRLSYALFFIMGSLLAANQLLVNNVTLAFHATDFEMGYMISALYVGPMVMVLFFGELAEHVGKRISCGIAAGFIGAGALMICLAPSVWVAVIGFAVYGAGIGSFESNVTALVTDNNPNRTNRIVNLLQAVFSVGAVLAPLLINAVVPPNQFRAVYAIVASVFAALVVYFVMTKSIDAFAQRNEELKGIAIFKLVKNPVMLAYMVAMITFVGMETASTYWIESYFSSEGFEGYGAIALAIYWLVSIAGRLLGSRMSSAAQLTVPCFVISAISTLMLIYVPGIVLKMIAVTLIGLANGPLYGGLALLGGSLYPKTSAAAFSLMIFSGALGGTIFQPIISALANNGNRKAVYILVAAVFFAIAILMYFTNRHTKKAQV